MIRINHLKPLAPYTSAVEFKIQWSDFIPYSDDDTDIETSVVIHGVNYNFSPVQYELAEGIARYLCKTRHLTAANFQDIILAVGAANVSQLADLLGRTKPDHYRDSRVFIDSGLLVPYIFPGSGPIFYSLLSWECVYYNETGAMFPVEHDFSD